MWLGATAIGAAMLGAAWLAEAHPLPGTALLLASTTLFLWYRIRFIP